MKKTVVFMLSSLLLLVSCDSAKDVNQKAELSVENQKVSCDCCPNCTFKPQE